MTSDMNVVRRPAPFKTSNEIDTRDYWLDRATDLLAESLAKWEDEEDSVKQEKASHIRDLNAFFCDWQASKPPMRPVPLVVKTLQGYARLHDGLSDMIEGGRLTEDDIPDDYQWLADALANLAPHIDKALSEACLVLRWPVYEISESPNENARRIVVEMDGRPVCSIEAPEGIADLHRQDARRIVSALELMDRVSQ